MPEGLADVLVWTPRLVLFAGLAWGAWLCIGQMLPPTGSERPLKLERFAVFALLALLLTTLGGIFHAG
jgi:hypothetical protein